MYKRQGILRSKVSLSDLELIDEPVITGPSMQRTGAGKIKMNKSATVRTEINLLGKTVDEAIAELDKYLDDAYLAHLSSVRVVHGKDVYKRQVRNNGMGSSCIKSSNDFPILIFSHWILGFVPVAKWCFHTNNLVNN